MRFHGVATPKDDEIGPVANFSQRASDQSGSLHGQRQPISQWTHLDVDARPQPAGNFDSGTLGFASCARQPVDKGVAGASQQTSGMIQSLIERDRLAADHCHRLITWTTLEERVFTERTGVVAGKDLTGIDRKFDVVASAAASRADDVRNRSQAQITSSDEQ
jgi:hypothetical protein